MKRIAWLLTVICAFLLTGCLATKTSNSLKAIPVEPTIEPLPIAADLVIAEQKSKGAASGSLSDRDRLIEEAVAKALGQETPSADNPDILIGKEVFEETRGKRLDLTVTGYPAKYANLRAARDGDSVRLLLAFDGRDGIPYLGAPPEAAYTPYSGVTRKEGKAATTAKRKIGWYVEGAYDLPITVYTASFGFNATFGGGIVFNNKMFLGLSLSWESGKDEGYEGYALGFSDGTLWAEDSAVAYRSAGGILLNFGGIYDISPDLKLVYGTSLGRFTAYGNEYNGETMQYQGKTYYGIDEIYEDYYFGLFAKLRYRFVELAYRGFIGDGYHNQLLAGVHFQF